MYYSIFVIIGLKKNQQQQMSIVRISSPRMPIWPKRMLTSHMLRFTCILFKEYMRVMCSKHKLVYGLHIALRIRNDFNYHCLGLGEQQQKSKQQRL